MDRRKWVLLLALLAGISRPVAAIEFASFRSFVVGCCAQGMVVGDFTGDGRVDVAFGFGDRISVVPGLGGEEFGLPRNTPVPNGAFGLQAADGDGDGKLDLFVVNKDGFHVFFYRGLGDGTFILGAAKRIEEGRPDRLGVADFDHDGVPDVAVATSVLGSNVWVYFGRRNGPGQYEFSSVGVQKIELFQPKEMLVADVNADGHADIVTSFSLLLGDGAGHFAFSGPPVRTFPADVQFITAIASADFNSDGAPDLAFGVVTVGPNTGAALIYHQLKIGGQPSGLFTLAQQIQGLDGGVSNIAVGQIDQQNPRDLIVTLNGNRARRFDRSGDGFVVLHGLPDGTFTTGRRFYSGGDPSFAAILDLTADGRSDLLMVNGSIFAGTLVVLRGDGTGNFNVPPTYFLDSFAEGIAAGDLDADGRVDLVVGTEGGVSVLLGNGDGTFRPPVLYPAGRGIAQLVIGDFNNDRRPDVAGLDAVSGTVYLLLGAGQGRLALGGTILLGFGDQIGAADFNGDGNLDITVSGEFDGRRSAVAVLYGNGSGGFSGQLFPTLDGYRPNRLMVADLVADLGPDIGLLHQQSYHFDFRSVLSIFPNLPGNPKLFPVFGQEIVVYPYIAHDDDHWPRPIDGFAADFDGDGIADAAIYRSRDMTTEIFRGNGSGGFTPIGRTFSGVDSTGMVAADFNCDGLPDIIQPDKGSDNVAVLVNTGAGHMATGPFYGVQTSPQWAAAADFNRDGLLDVAITNGHTGSVSILLSRTRCQPTQADPRGIKLALRAELAALRSGISDKDDRKKLDDAIESLEESLAPELWVDQAHLDPKKGDKVFQEEKNSVNKLRILLNEKKSSISDTLLFGFIRRFLAADRILATVAAQEAAVAGGDAKKIAEAQTQIARGDEDAAAGRYDSAIESYRNGWEKAMEAVKKL